MAKFLESKLSLGNTMVNFAVAICNARGLTLTNTRMEVLQILWENRKPMGAYQIIEVLRSNRQKRVDAPTVYRCLEFLLENRFISRIQSRNAFVPCIYPVRKHQCIFLICDICGNSLELISPSIEDTMAKNAESKEFLLGSSLIEVQGLCKHCAIKE